MTDRAHITTELRDAPGARDLTFTVPTDAQVVIATVGPGRAVYITDDCASVQYVTGSGELRPIERAVLRARFLAIAEMLA